MYPDLPEGMAIGDFTGHPVRGLIRDAAFHGTRGLPTSAELDALKLPAGVRADVENACRAVAEVHDTGDHAGAWALGDEWAATALGLLPEEQRSPSFYAAEPENLEGLGPAELAAKVRR
jgi:hypothetical protein